MQTVYAPYPGNPNLTLKLRVPTTPQPAEDDVYQRHFSSAGKNVGLLFADGERGFTVRSIKEAPIRGIYNISFTTYPDKRVGVTNSVVFNAINAFEGKKDVTQEDVMQWLKQVVVNFKIAIDIVSDKISKTFLEAIQKWTNFMKERVTPGKYNVSEFSKESIEILTAQYQSDTDDEETTIDEVKQDVNALVATLEEYYEQDIVNGDGSISVEDMVNKQVDRYAGDKTRTDQKFQWSSQIAQEIKELAVQWLKGRTIMAPPAAKPPQSVSPRGVAPPAVQPPQSVPQSVAPPAAAVQPPVLQPLPVVVKTAEHIFVERLENSLDAVMRRALAPLYHFVGGVAVALSDNDTRRFYKYKCQQPCITVEDLQSPVNKGNTTIATFYDANKHLGDLILQASVNEQARRDDLARAPTSGFQFVGLTVIDQTSKFRKQFREYAIQHAALPADENHPDVADWYYCATPYEVFWNLLSNNMIAAMEMAASDIWRFTGREDFTIPLMIKSVDTRDVFVLMTRNKYIISTGSIYSESLYVNQGGRGGTTKRLQTGSGNSIRDRRAAENLAGKHWWQDVVLVKDDPNPERRERLERIKAADQAEIAKLEGQLEDVARYDRLASVPGGIEGNRIDALLRLLNIAFPQSVPITSDNVREIRNSGAFKKEVEKKVLEVRELKAKLHCSEKMAYHLKYIRSPAPYGGGSFTATRRRTFF